MRESPAVELMELLRERMAEAKNGHLTTEFNPMAMIPDKGEAIPIQMAEAAKELGLSSLSPSNLDSLESNVRELIPAGHSDPEPPDKRTKAYRDWKARQDQ